MKKRPLLILFLVLALIAAIRGPAIVDDVQPALHALWGRVSTWLALPDTSSSGIARVENHFMVRTGSGAWQAESAAHLDIASYPDGFHFLPTVNETVNGCAYTLWDERQLQGAKDKFLSVENTGTVPVCFRTFIAMPDHGLTPYLVINRNTRDYAWQDGMQVTIDGSPYVMYIASYQGVLPPGQWAPASLLQVALQKDASLSRLTPFDIRVNTLIVSAEGFDGMDAGEILQNTLPLTQDINPF